MLADAPKLYDLLWDWWLLKKPVKKEKRKFSVVASSLFFSTPVDDRCDIMCPRCLHVEEYYPAQKTS